jgi:hypothetical protein
MKKLTTWCITAACILALYSLFTLSPVRAAQPTEAEVSESETAEVSVSCVKLEESEPWILEEVVSDYVSEEVVQLMEDGVSYEISDFITTDTHSYLFFEKQFPEGTVYTACGYAQRADGSCVYFELSSPEALTEEMVDAAVMKQL